MCLEYLKRQAGQLPSNEREKQVDGEHERLWRTEIESRYREYKEGKAELFDVDEVLAELRVVEEAERRLQGYLDGKIEAVPGEEALQRVRAALQ